MEWVSTIRTVLTTLKFRFVFPCTESGCIVGFNTKIINFSRVTIKKGSFLQDHVYLRAGMDGFIKIGNNVAINSFARLFGHGGITVGNNSQIGPGATLTTTSHDPENDMETIFRPVVIGEWSWIGANATILSGITIGNHVIIGAGSVVTKDIPDYAVAVGAPAKVIKWTNKDESQVAAG
jgi:acetyltransferase-like isoleucine patch superfamily enzyme